MLTVGSNQEIAWSLRFIVGVARPAPRVVAETMGHVGNNTDTSLMRENVKFNGDSPQRCGESHRFKPFPSLACIVAALHRP